MDKRIEQILTPDTGVLRVSQDKERYEMVINDAELDEVPCTFINDDHVTIHTDGLKWITLTYRHLYQILEAMEAVERVGYTDDKEPGQVIEYGC